MRPLSLAGAWLVMLVVATSLTWQIVSAAADRVGDRPAAPLNVAAPVLDVSGTTTTTPSDTTQDPGSGTDTEAPEPAPRPQEPASTSADAANDAEEPTTTTTTAEAPFLWRTVETPGGTVVLRYRPEEVLFEAATPLPGFQVAIREQGPPRVEVEFESETLKVRVRAEWRNRDLELTIG